MRSRMQSILSLVMMFAVLLGATAWGASTAAAQGTPAGAVATPEGEISPPDGSACDIATAANDFLSEPITFVTWSNPGGGGDVLGREMVAALDRQGLLPEGAVVENRAGGSGAVAMAHVLQQPTDGSTVLIVTKNLTLTPLTQDLDTDYRDFAPIQRSQLEPFYVAVRADAPYQNLQELVEAAKGGEVTFGGAFAGSTDNMMFSLLAEEAGFEMTYVPFESGGEAATALVGGSIDAISTSPQEVAALIDAGELRLLATPSTERVEAFPELPTFQEEGFDVVLEQWRGFVYADGVDPVIVECMNYLLWQASQDPGFQEYMEQNLLIDGYLPGDRFYELLEKETNENREFLEEAGLI